MEEVISCDDGSRSVDMDGVAGAGVDRGDDESSAEGYGVTGEGRNVANRSCSCA
jgi:hypothetical protein